MPSPQPFLLHSPLPPSDLWFESMTHSSGLSLLEEMQLTMLSTKSELKPEDLLGQVVTLEVALRGGAKRHFCGHVTRFGIGMHQGRYFGYQATVRPWLWMLTRTADCRIFQEQTVPEIVQTVFGDHGGIAQFRLKLQRSYRKRTYCVQYRESDFNFVARLLEDEGIYWYFEHELGQHTLVLVDDLGAHQPIAGEPKLPYFDAQAAPPDTDYIAQWRCSRGIRPGRSALTSYDFTRPSASLLVEQQLPRSHTQADLEVFDYLGDYTETSDGQQLVDDRQDAFAQRFERVAGWTSCHTMATGSLFTLANHPRADQNDEYLCVQADVAARSQSGEAGADTGSLQCTFAALRASEVFRPPRRTNKPFVQGPQTAVVVGPAGEEIHTDKYGRVKVQFHWDRYGQKNEKSSCWVRTSSPWAGKSFGFVQVPRIGQEVVVDFLEGDPDQPLITGRVYNAMQMPPWELPANATQSGVLSRSSKGGGYGNANALRFEDKAGAEQLWLHAEKDQLTEVEHDEDKWVGNDRRKTIDGNETNVVHKNRTETVDQNETITVHQNRTETVDLNETITIGVDRTETVGANETTSIGANRSITVGASETATVALQRTHTVGVNETIAIGAAQEVAIGGMQVVAVGAMQSTTVGASRSVDVGINQSHSVGSNRSAQVGSNDSLQVGKALTIDAGDSVTIKTGSASITMKSDGTIAIKGKDISIQGSGKINVKASSDVVIKGSKIGQN